MPAVDRHILARVGARKRSQRALGPNKVNIKFGPPPTYHTDLLAESDGPLDILGPTWEGAVPVVPMNDIDNFVAAVDKRVNYLDESRLPRSIREEAKLFLDEKVPEPLPQIEWSQELFDEWVVDYPAPKQSRLREACDTFHRFTQSDFANKEVFVKVEALLKRHDENWAGRIVNASSDLHNCMSGPILTRCLARLNAVLDPSNQAGHRFKATLAYKCGPRKIVDFLSSKGVGCLEADFSSNDATQVKDVQAIEGMWLRRLGAPEWLVHIMSKANTYKAYSRKFNMSANLRYQLPSGSTSTTFRNCIWNLTMASGWARTEDVACRVAVLGDDMVMVVDAWPYRKSARRHAKRSYEHYTATAHMKAKVKAHTSLCQAEFLSKTFVPAGEDYVMLPKLGRVLAKYNVRALVNPSVTDTEWQAGKSLSLAWEFRSYEPIATEFLNHYLALGIGVKKLHPDAMSWSLKQAVKHYGTTANILVQLFNVPGPSLTYDEFCQFTYFRYGVDGYYLEDLVHDTVFGVDDISFGRHWPVAAEDFW